jgi:hypothetical protein
MKPKIKNYNNTFYRPPDFTGLSELILFPDSEVKRRGSYDIPNSTIWVFDTRNHKHKYISQILHDDVGCGMTAFITEPLDIKAAADNVLGELKGKKILGRGNHFVDFCSGIKSLSEDYKSHNLMLLHTDVKSYNPELPTSIDEAVQKQRDAEEFREMLGSSLLEKLGASYQLLGNWNHNSVESIDADDKVVYRKGVVKLNPGELGVFPASLGRMILFYTLNEDTPPEYNSFPHATGRAGPRGATKVSLEEASELRNSLYIPEEIKDTALRSEHPSCYNDFENILNKLSKKIHLIGESEILGYVGKV